MAEKKSWFKKLRESVSPFSRKQFATAPKKKKKTVSPKRKPIDYAARVKERPPQTNVSKYGSQKKKKGVK